MRWENARNQPGKFRSYDQASKLTHRPDVKASRETPSSPRNVISPEAITRDGSFGASSFARFLSSIILMKSLGRTFELSISWRFMGIYWDG